MVGVGNGRASEMLDEPGDGEAARRREERRHPFRIVTLEHDGLVEDRVADLDVLKPEEGAEPGEGVLALGLASRGRAVGSAPGSG